MVSLVWLVPLLPLLGVIVNGLFGRTLIREKAHLVAVSAAGLSCLVALLVFLDALRGATLDWDLYTWMAAGEFRVSVGFLVDPLSAVMMLMVTFVGFVIHVYSIGYMHGDPGYPRFFTYMNLFMFAMLMLVLANNYLVMFLGWEGVGLCSYLLIGYWYEKHSASTAGNKAFIVNRVGDFGFLLGLFLLWTAFGTFQYREIFARAPDVLPAGGALVTILTLLLFVGAVGKSAQLPLYVWLPDAMEGPTPVSALIHAATMVTAGVYMVARSGALFNLAPLSAEVVAVVGALTAVFAATIACVQTDIKRVVAYSTISQLGYMFLGAGVGAYASSIFHLTTHAFFKALLFLGCGAVIHALHHEQDMWRMGGLRKVMPITAATFLIAALANAGIFPLAGFWSKDEILFAAWSRGHTVLWALGAAGAFLTAFYMFRLYFVTFAGPSRVDPHQAGHLHEAPPVMTRPLLVLAVFAVGIGAAVGFPPEQGLFHRFLAPALAAAHGGPAHGGVTLEVGMALVSLAIAGAGILLAYKLYVVSPELPERLATRFRPLHTLLLRKYYLDEAYNAIFVNGFLRLSRLMWRGDDRVVDGAVNGTAMATVGASVFSAWRLDLGIVDGLVNWIADALQGGSNRVKRVQTGLVQNYIMAMALGIFAIVSLYLFLGGQLF
jgi:NADH-quinone oxidoreductase subunit L